MIKEALSKLANLRAKKQLLVDKVTVVLNSDEISRNELETIRESIQAVNNVKAVYFHFRS